MYGYQLQIYGSRRMESNMSTASCFNMSLKQLLVWPVENDMLKNGVKYLKKTIYGAPFSMYRYQLEIYGYSTIKSNISTASSCNTSLKQLLVWPVEKDMLKNGVKYFKMTIYGAPFSMQRYQLQIYGCSTMTPNMSTAFSCNMNLKQVLVWPVEKDMLKNGVNYLKKKQFMEPPLLHMGINCRSMVVAEWNLSCQQHPVLI